MLRETEDQNILERIDARISRQVKDPIILSTVNSEISVMGKREDISKELVEMPCNLTNAQKKSGDNVIISVMILYKCTTLASF